MLLSITPALVLGRHEQQTLLRDVLDHPAFTRQQRERMEAQMPQASWAQLVEWCAHYALVAHEWEDTTHAEEDRRWAAEEADPFTKLFSVIRG